MIYFKHFPPLYPNLFRIYYTICNIPGLGEGVGIVQGIENVNIYFLRFCKIFPNLVENY